MLPTTPLRGFHPTPSQIVFHSWRDGGGVYVISVLGGDARGDDPAHRWSTDGTRRRRYGLGTQGGGADKPDAVGGGAIRVVAARALDPVRDLGDARQRCRLFP